MHAADGGNPKVGLSRRAPDWGCSRVPSRRDSYEPDGRVRRKRTRPWSPIVAASSGWAIVVLPSDSGDRPGDGGSGISLNELKLAPIGTDHEVVVLAAVFRRVSACTVTVHGVSWFLPEILVNDAGDALC